MTSVVAAFAQSTFAATDRQSRSACAITFVDGQTDDRSHPRRQKDRLSLIGLSGEMSEIWNGEAPLPQRRDTATMKI
jgi:hypothetical protein